MSNSKPIPARPLDQQPSKAGASDKCPECKRGSFYWEGCSHSVCPKRAFYAKTLNLNQTAQPYQTAPNSLAGKVTHSHNVGSDQFRAMPTNMEDEANDDYNTDDTFDHGDVPPWE
jgi:hypothetical protein